MKNILPVFDNQELYRLDVSSSKFTWFRTGGVIDVVFRPTNIDELQYFLANFPDKKSIKVLGACSNIIIRDGGIKGVVIRLGKGFNYINKIDDITLEIGGATLDSNIASFAMENGIGGLEFLASIPGSLGGNVYMNAGCYGSDISQILVEYEAVDFYGKLHRFKRDEIDFTYRHNPIRDGYIITKAVLEGVRSTSQEVAKLMLDIKEKRESSQPVKSNTGGSTFVNPEGHKAWQLIADCGLRGVKLGNAQFSMQHCNFLINIGGAMSIEIEALGELARSCVMQKFGINLQWEIERYGDFARSD